MIDSRSFGHYIERVLRVKGTWQMVKIINENDLVYAIANRVRVLGDKKLNELRSIAGYGCDSEAEAIQMNKHHSRAELLQGIIVEEFVKEFPRGFEEE